MITSSFHSDTEPQKRRRKARKVRIAKETIKKGKATSRRETNKVILDQTTTIRLKNWHELESWQQDNEFLLSGYRSASNSYRKSLASLSYIHNQTANIYSHLFGAIVFIAAFLFIYFELVPRYKTADLYDVLAFVSFFTGALICFGCSAFFHTVGNHSHEVYQSWLLLDLYGILCLICGTVFSGTFFGFYCEPRVWMTYSIEVWPAKCSTAVSEFLLVWFELDGCDLQIPELVEIGINADIGRRSHSLPSLEAASALSRGFAPQNGGLYAQGFLVLFCFLVLCL